VRFYHTLSTLGPGRNRGLVANVEINYLDEGNFPAEMTIASGIGLLGTRSWQTLSLALQDGKPLATCDVTIVSTGVDQTDPAFRAEIEKRLVREPV
jgi:acyl-CoA thioester hydrolase